MRPLADLLGEVLQIGDVIGVSQIRRRHLPEGIMAELVKQTHEHALANALGRSYASRRMRISTVTWADDR